MGAPSVTKRRKRFVLVGAPNRDGERFAEGQFAADELVLETKLASIAGRNGVIAARVSAQFRARESEVARRRPRVLEDDVRDVVFVGDLEVGAIHEDGRDVMHGAGRDGSKRVVVGRERHQVVAFGEFSAH